MVRSSRILPALLCMAGIASALSPIETFGPLRTVGNRLCDSAGKPVTLRGMSLGYHCAFGSRDYWNRSAVHWTQSDWRASVVRAQVFAGDTLLGFGGNGYRGDSTMTLARTRAVIDAAIRSGMYVVVDFEYAGTAYDIDAAKRFFGTLGAEYGSYPNVIWEIWGEPTSSETEQQIVEYAKAVVPVIRRNSPDNLILIPTAQYCGGKPTAMLVSAAKVFGNHAFSIHMAAGNTSPTTAVLSDSVPLFVSEWGTSDASGNGVFADSASKALFQAMDSLGISNCNWGLFAMTQDIQPAPSTSSTASALVLNASPFGAWGAADLTPSGTLVSGYLRGANPAWTFPDSVLSLAFDRDSAELKKDSVAIRAVARWPLNWTLTLRGRASGKSASIYSSSPTRIFEAKWLAGKISMLSSMSVGEWVDIKNDSTGWRDSLYLGSSTSTFVDRGGEPLRRSGDGRHFRIPESFGVPGDRVLVRVMDVGGRLESEQHPAIDEHGLLDVGSGAQAPSIRVLELRNGGRSLHLVLPPLE